MNKKETREFIFRFYRKRVTSFLANLYKASITGDNEDIHKARVDVKKIIALFRLFEMIVPDSFTKKDHFVLFTKLFETTGKIRETQVNLLLLDLYGIDHPEIVLFRNFLKNEEKRFTKGFLTTVQKFEEKNLKKTETEIKQIGEKISQKKFICAANTFIQKKAEKIRKLLTNKKTPEYLHKIRQNLKAIGAIATLSATFKKDKKLDLILLDLSKTEIHIGEWHDKQVLIESMELFFKKKKKSKKSDFPELIKLTELLIEESNNLQEKILPEVKNLIQNMVGHPTESLPIVPSTNLEGNN